MGAPLFDEAYLRALANRKEDTEQHLISHFSRPVQSKLRARLRSPELVQDAYQETFLRVFTYFRSGKTLDNPASLPGFIHTVCHNIALEFLRSHTRHQQMPEDAADPVDRSVDPETRLVTEERKEAVRRIIQDLPEKDRELLRRVFLNEEDKDLVCKDLSVGREYLRVLLYRARARLKAALLQSGFSRAARRASS